MRVGVPIAVLTDGKTWQFFLPAGQGSFEERRFARMHLQLDDAAQSEQTLTRYLDYDTVKSGKAPAHAQADLKRKQLERAYGQAWQRVVARPASRFLRLFLQEVRQVAALDPTEEDAAAWIRRRAGGDPPPPRRTGRRGADASRGGAHPPPPPDPPPPFQHWVEFRGERHAVRSGIDGLVKAFSLLGAEDPNMFQRYRDRHLRQTRQGQPKPRVARTRAEIYPNSELRGRCKPLPGGWWIDSNLSNTQKAKWIKDACELAGVRFGTELVVSFPGKSG